jgi:hypothetical protein
MGIVIATAAGAALAVTSARPKARSLREMDAPLASPPEQAASTDRRLAAPRLVVAPPASPEDPEPAEPTSAAKSPETPPAPTAGETTEAVLKSVEATGYAGGPWTDTLRGLVADWEKGLGSLAPGSRILPARCYQGGCIARSIVTDPAEARRIAEAANDLFRQWTGARVHLPSEVDAAGSTTFTWVLYNPGGPGPDLALLRRE